MTRKMRRPAPSPVMGTKRMRASAASAPPMAQFAAAITLGETASAAAARGFSATAAVATPKGVNL